MPPVSVLIKPASGRCGLRCRYCFYHDVSAKRLTPDYGLMPEETLERIVEKTLRFAEGEATFAFQGGEPTLCGLDFFRCLTELEQRYNEKGVTIQNCIQTNGMHIDEAWARFLAENHFLVGLSLDGFAAHHDKNRLDAAGRGTFDRVMETVALFDRFGVQYNILLVVTGDSASAATELYAFFKERHFDYLQFIPCLDPEGEERGGHDYSLTPALYARFLKRFFNRWAADLLRGREVSVRYFDNLVRMVMGLPPETCSLIGCCQCQFVFEADGSCYPCDFYVTDRWRMGNIRDMDLKELAASPAAAEFVKGSEPVPAECRACSLYPLCRNGCRRDRVEDETGPGLNYYCAAYKEFLAYALPKLRELAAFVQSRAPRGLGQRTQ